MWQLICAASSCNTYTKTFGGIDGAGRRLADEVSIQNLNIFSFDCFSLSIRYVA